MKTLWQLLVRSGIFVPLLTLAFVSLVGVFLLVLRICWTGQLAEGYLAWNLFLAWIPIGFALLARHRYHDPASPRWQWLALAGAWLLFFPNSSYICTDLIHLKTWMYGRVWIDLCLILLFAFIGLVLGFLSLRVMQSVVAHRAGFVAGWGFVLIAAGLSSVGVYLGRFLRLNSWDVLVRPGKIWSGLAGWPDHLGNGHSVAFLGLFTAFLFLSHLILHALTHMPADPRPLRDAQQ